MPSPANIHAPITLFGSPRSGTSVLYRAFAYHPDIDAAGESAGLIFTSWRALEQISGLTRYGRMEKKDFGPDAAGLVRHAFLTVLPSDKKEWMHKPIGLPRIYRDFVEEPDSDEFVGWYWSVFRQCFPQSRNLAIVRHPFDILLSARSYGIRDAGAWRTLRFLYRSLVLAREELRIVVHYDELIANPVAALKRICEAVALDFHPNMPKAFDTLHVPAKGTIFGTAEELAEKRKTAFSHRGDWEELVVDDYARVALERYQEVVSLFGLHETAAGVTEATP